MRGWTGDHVYLAVQCLSQVQAQKSSGGLGLALLCLIDRLKKFDCWDATKEAATSDGGGQASAGVQGRSRKRVRG